MNKALYLAFIFILPFFGLFANTENKEALHWQQWSPEIFELAQKEDKLILLNLEAVWCHWCHVMDETTYRDPEVLKEINQNFIPVRVDHAAHPELSDRYEDYGWPATIIFASDGTEVIKRRGYIQPDWMKWMLQAVAENPDPSAHDNKVSTVNASDKARLTKKQKELLETRYQFVYDAEHGGWGRVHKFIHNDSIEYALTRASEGSKLHEIMARQTLWAAQQLIDPEWGGVYQYSDSMDWKSLHFEKIMAAQTDAIRLYSMAYVQWKNKDYLSAAQETLRFLDEKLFSPEGAYYTSQDADLNKDIYGKQYFALNNEERLKLGIPAVDKNLYARENAWVVSALLTLYNTTSEQTLLDKAIKLSNWILENRKLQKSGGYAHGEDRKQIFLSDTLATGRAFLDLYTSTADLQWLELSKEAANFILENFQLEGGGYISTPDTENKSILQSPTLHLDSQIKIARYGNLLAFISGDKKYLTMADHAMNHLMSTDITNQRRLLGGVLLANLEMSKDPVHITIVGKKKSQHASKLFTAALKSPSHFKRIEWWDKTEGDLPNMDVTYPQLDKPAAFICTNGACSSPIFEPEKIDSTLKRIQNL